MRLRRLRRDWAADSKIAESNDKPRHDGGGRKLCGAAALIGIVVHTVFVRAPAERWPASRKPKRLSQSRVKGLHMKWHLRVWPRLFGLHTQ